MLIGKENVDESWNLLLTLLIFEMPRKLKYEMKLIMKEKLPNPSIIISFTTSIANA